MPTHEGGSEIGDKDAPTSISSVLEGYGIAGDNPKDKRN